MFSVDLQFKKLKRLKKNCLRAEPARKLMGAWRIGIYSNDTAGDVRDVCKESDFIFK